MSQINVKKRWSNYYKTVNYSIKYQSTENFSNFSPQFFFSKKPTGGVSYSLKLKGNLFCRFPLATNWRHNSTFFFQFSKNLVNFLAVSTENFCHFASRYRFARLPHCI